MPLGEKLFKHVMCNWKLLYIHYPHSWNWLIALLVNKNFYLIARTNIDIKYAIYTVIHHEVLNCKWVKIARHKSAVFFMVLPIFHWAHLLTPSHHGLMFIDLSTTVTSGSVPLKIECAYRWWSSKAWNSCIVFSDFYWFSLW